jgi:branched-chain amino acid transport system substrate-binding protein
MIRASIDSDGQAMMAKWQRAAAAALAAVSMLAAHAASAPNVQPDGKPLGQVNSKPLNQPNSQPNGQLKSQPAGTPIPLALIEGMSGPFATARAAPRKRSCSYAPPPTATSVTSCKATVRRSPPR